MTPPSASPHRNLPAPKSGLETISSIDDASTSSAKTDIPLDNPVIDPDANVKTLPSRPNAVTTLSLMPPLRKGSVDSHASNETGSIAPAPTSINGNRRSPYPHRMDISSSNYDSMRTSVPQDRKNTPVYSVESNSLGESRDVGPPYSRQQQLMNFLSGYSANQGTTFGDGMSNPYLAMQSMVQSGSGPSGEGPNGFNGGLFGMSSASAGPGALHNTGLGLGSHLNTQAQSTFPNQHVDVDSNTINLMSPASYKWPEINEPNGQPAIHGQMQQFPQNQVVATMPMRNPIIEGIKSAHSSPASTPLLNSSATLPPSHTPVSFSSSNYINTSAPISLNNVSHQSRPVGLSFPLQIQGQSMGIGSIALRRSNKINQQQAQAPAEVKSRSESVASNKSLAGMAPRPLQTPAPYVHESRSQTATPVAPNWGHIGLPEASPMSTPILGSSNNTPMVPDWMESRNHLSQSETKPEPNLFREVASEPDASSGPPFSKHRSGSTTPASVVAGHIAGTMSVPASPNQQLNAPSGQHAGLMRGVENALAGLSTGLGDNQRASFSGSRSKKKILSAGSSRANSPERRRKSAVVFSYSGALSAVNSRASSPVLATESSTTEADKGSADVDMNALGRALQVEQKSAQAGFMDPPKQPLSESSNLANHNDNKIGKADYRKRKRNRTIQSCLPCHQNKRKCDRKKPCSRCKALGLTGSCVYEVDHERDENDPDQTENDHLRDRIAELEQVVRELRQKGAVKTGMLTEDQETNSHKKRKLVVEVVDYAHKDGKNSASSSRRTSLSEGHGDDSRRPSVRTHASGSRRSSPAHGEEPYMAHATTAPGEFLIGDALGRQAYVGIPGGRNMLRRLADLTAARAGGQDLPDAHRGEPLESAAFTGFFPDQRKTFPFTTIWSHEHFSSEVVGILPTEAQAQILWRSFEEEIARYFSAWHLPSLRAEFEAFFQLSQEDQMMTTLGTLSVMLMVCSLAVMVRASEKEIFGTISVVSPDATPEDEDLTCSRMQSELYLSGAYQALRLCSFMSSPTISTITSEIMMVIYLLNSERASDAWPELGIVIRQAVAMGLHIDPLQLYPDLSIRDAEVRRRVWWTIAGLDALLCLSLGRPSAISYHTTKLPQDWPDQDLSNHLDPASEQIATGETTEFTYHSCYFALTIPSFDILGRVFRQDHRYARRTRTSGVRDWFSPPAPEDPDADNLEGAFTYDDALRLDSDIVSWYSLVPSGMKFDPELDTPEVLVNLRPQWQINQTLALCVKMQMTRLILHRPYLRIDPAAYAHSSEICFDAAHSILAAFRAMSATKSSVAWSWWTMSLRAFHAGTVCAFLAIRQPDNPIANQCLDDIRGAITIFAGRLRTWLKAHPVQGHLCQGLISLERLAATAIRLSQKSASNRPTSARYFNKSHIQAFPSLNNIPTSPNHNILPTPGSSLALNMTGRMPEEIDPTPFQHVFPVTQRSAVMENAAGARGAADAMALPQFWSDVFGLPMEEDRTDPNPLLAL